MEKSAEENKRNRRPRRSKADIDRAIEQATIEQIKQTGFVHSQVTDIVKRAEIEPVVFYNRYKNLDEFFDQFAKNHSNWLNETQHEQKNPTNADEYAEALDSLFDYLLSNDLIAELLRWELAEYTPTTKNLVIEHEADLIEYTDKLARRAKAISISDAKTISALVIAGLYYMILNKKNSNFAGIDITTLDGKQRIYKALKLIGTILYQRPNKITR